MLKSQELGRAISSYATETLFNCHTTLPFWSHVSPDGRPYSGFHQYFKFEKLLISVPCKIQAALKIKFSSPNATGWAEGLQLYLNIPETKDLVHPGPMRGILPVLHGRCTAFRSLSIRQPGFFADVDQFHHIADDQFVQEFALFLRSVKPTLQRLEYEMGHPFEIEQTDIESPPRRDWFGNQQFVRYLLPVLLEPEWPAIQAVSIFGVSWMGDDDDRVKKNLYQVLGKAVSLEIRS